MDNQNQSFSLDLNATNQASPTQNASANPLNTGNGTPIKEMPIEQLTPVPPSPTDPEKSGKKIIIYIIVAILFAAVSYGAYLFFMKGDAPSETNADKPPTIDIPTPEEDNSSAKMEELEAVVEELRGVYGDNPATEPADEETAEPEDISAPEDETTSPPSLTIEDSPEEAPKVLR